MKTLKLLLLMFALTGVYACDGEYEDKAEDMGDAIEETADDTMDNLDEAAEDAEDSVEDATDQ